MTNRRVFLAASLVALALVVGPGRLAAQAIQRSLYVSVLNEAGEPVSGLGPSDFIVREDNVAREVLNVVRADEPMHLALLIDNSQAARDDIANIRQALPAFIAALTPAGEGVKHDISMIAVGGRPTILIEYTTNRVTLQKSTDRLWPQPGGGAYLLDAIVEACQGLKKREASRPVIVAVTLEGPDFSNRLHDQVLDPLRASGAALHVITIGPPSAGSSDEIRERDLVLDEGPRTTGGRRDRLLTSMALGGAFTRLAEELTHQYRITYARPQSLIPPGHVTVASSTPGLEARGTLVNASLRTP
jgi:VWFA-related protein